jgi:hypothetical protein
MTDTEKEQRLEAIKKEIINLQAQAHSLRTEADKHVAAAQELSSKRLDILEKTHSLAREHEAIKRGNA